MAQITIPETGETLSTRRRHSYPVYDVVTNRVFLGLDPRGLRSLLYTISRAEDPPNGWDLLTFVPAGSLRVPTRLSSGHRGLRDALAAAATHYKKSPSFAEEVRFLAREKPSLAQIEKDRWATPSPHGDKWKVSYRTIPTTMDPATEPRWPWEDQHWVAEFYDERSHALRRYDELEDSGAISTIQLFEMDKRPDAQPGAMRLDREYPGVITPDPRTGRMPNPASSNAELVNKLKF